MLVNGGGEMNRISVLPRLFVGALGAVVVLLVSVSAGAQAPARDGVSDGVGATFGEFRVDETGNASYQIPIYAPPGTAGVAPKIALVYNSGGGNGWIGKGWSISGLSAVTRCRKPAKRAISSMRGFRSTATRGR